MKGRAHPDRYPQREFPFIPRIINPIKIRDVILFSADEAIRKSQRIIQADMPWVNVQVHSNPLTVSAIHSDGAGVLILDDVAMNLVDIEKIRRNNNDVVIALLSFVRLIQCSPPQIARREFPYTGDADLVFAANRGEFAPDKIITAVVRSAEDHLNIEKRSEVRRFILLIVDDEPNWPSQFLPILYKIIGQRADVKITRTYEEALKFMFGVEDETEISEDYRDFGYGDQVVCLITDILFPQGDKITADAGRSLIGLVNRFYIRIPIIIASQAKDLPALADKGFVLAKGDPGSLETLGSYIRDRTGIGDFVIYDESGEEVHRAKDVRGMYALLSKADGKSPEADRLRSLLEIYGERDKFSTWLYMHGFRALGDTLRPQKLKGERMIAVLRRSLRSAMLKMQYTPLVVDGIKVFNLQDLRTVLQSVPAEQLEHLSHNDIISSWLDQKGYSELADALRPIHGTGSELRAAIRGAVEEWMNTYGERSRSSSGSGEL